VITVDQTVFKSKLRRYAVIANKGIKEAVAEEAKFTAKRLMDLTPPKSVGQGKRRIASDIQRVYLSPKWFTEVFAFRNERFGERVKRAVRRTDTSELKEIFSNSSSLSKLHLEAFNEGVIGRLRRNGSVGKGIAPYSFPLQDESKRKAFEEKKKKLSGLAKSGWASCYGKLGGSVPGWLNRSGKGRIIMAGDNSITLVNTVPYMSRIDAVRGITTRAVTGRQKDLQKKIELALKGK
jgi:hypothetical protein